METKSKIRFTNLTDGLGARKNIVRVEIDGYEIKNVMDYKITPYGGAAMVVLSFLADCELVDEKVEGR